MVEYASIIGLIKRSQRILGKVMTVSGVIFAFRKRALLDCGLWDKDLITDDIGVTWKLQRRFWDVRYEPRALCWMLVPETLKGLGILWCFAGVVATVLMLFGFKLDETLVPGFWPGIYLALVCIIQFIASYAIERRDRAGLCLGGLVLDHLLVLQPGHSPLRLPEGAPEKAAVCHLGEP